MSQSEIQSDQKVLRPKVNKKSPSLISFAKMPERKIYETLRIMPESIYYGFDLRDIRKGLSKYEATKYLNELVMVNSVGKSGLHLISEMSGESQSIQAVSYQDLDLEAIDRSIEFGCLVNQD